MAGSPHPHVLITRPQPFADRTAAAVAQLGGIPVVAPLQTIRYKTCINDLGLPPAGVILTSQHAVPSLVHLQLNPNTPVYAVGSATGAAVQSVGFTDVTWASGSASQLLQLLAQKGPSTGPYVYLSGSDVRLDLADVLRQKGYVAERLVVYETQEVEDLPGEVKELLGAGKIAYALLYSPRAAKIFTRLVHHEDVAGINAICLSADVASELRSLNLAAVHVVEHREDRAMIDKVKELIA